MYYDQVHDIYLVSKMGQIIKVQRPVSLASISGLYVILEAAFTIALLGVLLYKYNYITYSAFYMFNTIVPKYYTIAKYITIKLHIKLLFLISDMLINTI